MSKKIFYSGFTISLSATLLTLLLVIFTMYSILEKQIKKDLSNEMVLLAKGVGDEGVAYLEGLNPDFPRNVVLLDEDGDILYTNQPSRVQDPIGENRQRSYEEAMENGSNMTTYVTGRLTETRTLYSKALPDRTILQLTARSRSIYSMLLSSIPVLILVLILAGGLSTILARQSANQIMEPLKHLDLEHAASNNTYEELQPLLERISSQQSQLRNLTEEKLRAQENRHWQFIANISHELKTPLTSISGFAELLMRNTLSENQTRDFAQAIHQESKRLIRLSDDRQSSLSKTNIVIIVTKDFNSTVIRTAMIHSIIHYF